MLYCKIDKRKNTSYLSNNCKYDVFYNYVKILNLMTLTCWFLFIVHLLYYASSGSLYPAFCIALSKSANVIFSLFIEKSLHISHKIFKIYETPTIITLIIENASIFPRDILETNKPIMLIITEIIR